MVLTPVDRSDDASPASAVANAAALTAANSSVGADGIDGNTDDNDWPTRVWDFSTRWNESGFEMDYRFCQQRSHRAVEVSLRYGTVADAADTADVRWGYSGSGQDAVVM